jgi:MscS family membrane protein
MRFEPVFRGFMVFLLVMFAWGIWAGAQPATNQVSAEAATNKPAALIKGIEPFHGRYLTFGLDRIAIFREMTLLNEPLWKYIALLVYLVLAYYVSKAIDFIIHCWLSKLAARTQTKVDDLLLEVLRGPLKVLVFVIFLAIGLNAFVWSPASERYISKGFVIVMAAAVTYLTIKISYLLLDLWKARTAHEADHKFNNQLFSIIRRSLGGFIIIVAVLVTASNIGINITAAITSLSIGGLAVGLAAQDTLANLFGAVAVFADKPFRVGDQIKLDAAEGVVEIIGMRSTRVRNSEGHLVAVPNKIMGNAPITNISRRASIKTTMNLALARTLPTEKVKRALVLLEEIYRGHPLTQDVWISFNQFAGSALNVMVVHWAKGTDYQKYLAALQEMNLSVKEQFDAEGITFA